MTRSHRFFDAPHPARCQAMVKLRDGTTAQCGRYREWGRRFCWQHSRKDWTSEKKDGTG